MVCQNAQARPSLRDPVISTSWRRQLCVPRLRVRGCHRSLKVKTRLPSCLENSAAKKAERHAPIACRQSGADRSPKRRLPLDGQTRRNELTVCIAAAAANGTAVVAASDRMLSAHFLSLEFDHPDAKIDLLGPTCVGLSSGDALPTGELFSAAYGVSTQLQNPQVGQIAEQIKEQYSALRKKRIEEQLFRPRGITVDEFYQGGLIQRFPPEVAMSLDHHVQTMEFGVELIIAGVDGNGAHIFGISDPGVASSYDRVGYHAIGSGMSHALLSLVGTAQHWSHGINQTVFNVYRAKRQAEAAPGVGRAIEMRVVTVGGCRTVTETEFDQLEEAAKKLMSPREQEAQKLITSLPFEEDGNGAQAATAS